MNERDVQNVLSGTGSRGGGDCLRCMAIVAEDPDCWAAYRALEGWLPYSGAPHGTPNEDDCEWGLESGGAVRVMEEWEFDYWCSSHWRWRLGAGAGD